MDVMIIPEDPRLDQYVLKPIVERIFADIAIPANVHVLQDPRMRGVSEALDPEMIREEVIALYPMVDLFLVIVDRDCDRDANEARAQTLQDRIDAELLVCLAREEVEAWMLCLQRTKLHQHLGVSFRDVRESCDPKDHFAEPLLEELGWTTKVGKGRKYAMRNLDNPWSSLFEICDELADFRRRIENYLR